MHMKYAINRGDELPEESSYHRSLKRKIVVTILLMSITPLVLISGSILYYLEASYKEKAVDYLKIVVMKHRDEIDSFLNERLVDLKVIAASHPLDRLVNPDFLEAKLQAMHGAQSLGFVDLGVVNSEGAQIAYAGPFKLGRADYYDALWFRRAAIQDSYISDVFMGLRGLPHFIVTVRKESNGRTWILRGTVDFESFNALVHGIRIGETGLAFILNRSGELQTEAGPLTVSDKKQAAQVITASATSMTEVRVIEKQDREGSPTLYVTAPLKDGDWLLVYRQNARDAFSVIYRARTIAAAVFVSAFTAIVIVTVLIARNMVQRIADADAQKRLMNEQVIHAGKLASIGELASGVAHEINNPLAIIMEEAGWMEDLLTEEDIRGTANYEEYRRALEQIRAQGKRCKGITHKLLSFARKTDPEPKDIQLNEIVEEVVSLSRQRIKYGNVTIASHMQPDLPCVQASPSEMQQVLLNIINNSLDAMEPDGGNIGITTRTENAQVVIDIEDDGPGIPESILPRIFDPFFTTKAVGRGTGLGLSICYGIVQKMEGELSVASSVGKGTVFHIRLPVSPDSRSD